MSIYISNKIINVLSQTLTERIEVGKNELVIKERISRRKASVEIFLRS